MEPEGAATPAVDRKEGILKLFDSFKLLYTLHQENIKLIIYIVLIIKVNIVNKPSRIRYNKRVVFSTIL